MPAEFEVVVMGGLGAASNTVALQAPLLRPYFPEIDKCRHATINFGLPVPLQVRLPDIVTPPLPWPGNGSAERFGITKIRLTLLDDARPHDAWIYTPELSPHRSNDRMIEVLTEPLSGIRVGAKCRIYIERCIQISILVI
jgi:hypothetical protein